MYIKATFKNGLTSEWCESAKATKNLIEQLTQSDKVLKIEDIDGKIIYIAEEIINKKAENKFNELKEKYNECVTYFTAAERDAAGTDGWREENLKMPATQKYNNAIIKRKNFEKVLGLCEEFKTVFKNNFKSLKKEQQKEVVKMRCGIEKRIAPLCNAYIEGWYKVWGNKKEQQKEEITDSLLVRKIPMTQDEIEEIEQFADMKNGVIIGRPFGFIVSVAKAKNGKGSYLIVNKPTGEYHNWTYGHSFAIEQRAKMICGKA